MAIGRIPEPGTGIPESIVDAKGDIVTATAADTPARLAVGTNEQRLVADSAAATGLKYVSDTTNYAVAAKGDLLVGTAADTVAVLSVGTNGHTLVADSSVSPTGLKWAAPSAGGFVGAQLTKTAQSVANDDYYAVTWDSEAFDTDAFHDNSTNNSRVTIPSGKSGYYRFSGIITFAQNATGSRLVRVHKNGSNIVWVGWLAGQVGTNETGVVFCHTLNATAGDYFELFVKQVSGGALNVTASASWDVQYLGA